MVHRDDLDTILGPKNDDPPKAEATKKITSQSPKKWSRDFQNKVDQIADRHLTFEEVFARFNAAIAPERVGENKFRKEYWSKIPDDKKRDGDDNARTLAAKKGP
jgi:hypothetical protein